MPLVFLLLATLFLQAPPAASAPGSQVQKASVSRDAKVWEDARIPDLIEAMRIKPGDSVADVGCGDGIFTVPLARAVGEKGRVYAVDIDKDALRAARKRLQEANLKNVELVLGREGDPLLPTSALDSVFIMNTYH
jgi:ubiquinone/menaquinone biosynthesis C-methylase UbiE